LHIDLKISLLVDWVRNIRSWLHHFPHMAVSFLSGLNALFRSLNIISINTEVGNWVVNWIASWSLLMLVLTAAS
jgi:hypothetical protein